MSDLHVSCDFISLYLIVLIFAMRLKIANYESYWNVLVFCNQRKIMSDLNIYHDIWNIWFFSFPLFGLTLVIKPRNFDFECHWNTLIYFDKKRYGVRIEFVPCKISDFVSFPLLGLTLVIKLRNSDFEIHWNTLIYFDKKRYGVRFEYVLWKNVWFCFISIAYVHFFHITDKFRFWKSLKYFNIFR